jgi:hypothetical protein
VWVASSYEVDAMVVAQTKGLYHDSYSESQLPCNVSEFNLHLTSENCRATRVNQVGDIAPLLGISILPCPIQELLDVLGDGIVFHGVEDQQYFCKVTICATI